MATTTYTYDDIIVYKLKSKRILIISLYMLLSTIGEFVLALSKILYLCTIKKMIKLYEYRK